MNILCPVCDTPLPNELDAYKGGETFACGHCGTTLEVLSVDPPSIRAAHTQPKQTGESHHVDAPLDSE